MTTHLDCVTTRAVLDALESTSSGVMLFGSTARGDRSVNSDIDVLELVSRRSKPYRIGRFNVSAYDKDTLIGLARRGSLFILHLKREGRILRDPTGELENCIASYREPSSYENYLEAVGSLMALLDVQHSGYSARWKAYNQVVVYIIRSVLYAQFAQSGVPAFATSALIERCPEPNLPTALALKRAVRPNFGSFSTARELAEKLTGESAVNPFGSMEALITNLAEVNPLIVGLGLRLLGEESFDLTYDLLAFPPFAL